MLKLYLALSADDGSQKGSTGPTQPVVAASGKLMHFSAATTAATAATVTAATAAAAAIATKYQQQQIAVTTLCKAMTMATALQLIASNVANIYQPPTHPLPKQTTRGHSASSTLHSPHITQVQSIQCAFCLT